MFKSLSLTILLTTFSYVVFSQNNVGIGTLAPDPSSVLDLTASDKGLLVPRMTTAQRVAIASPANALLVYDTDVECYFYYKTSSSSWLNLCQSGPAGATGANGVTGPAGPAGVNGTNGNDGANGTAGPAGANGTNGNDGATGPAGPAGPAGANGTNGNDGATGPAGPAGVNGTNGNDGAVGPAGANGTNGNNGATGPAGPAGPPGIIQKYHKYGTSGRLGVTLNTAMLQPGLAQTFTLTAPATVIIWATIGGRTTSTTTNAHANVDMIIYLNGTFLPNGGWNRFSVVNPTSTNAFNTCAINTMITLPAGTHTIDLRTLRSSGPSAVDIGGNSALDTNPGELTIMILN